MTDSQTIVQKLWNYCNILRDDGLSYGDYVEQLTFLLFLKMADERTRPPYNEKPAVPKGYDWQSLTRIKSGPELDSHYRHILETLGREAGILGVIFSKAQNKIQDPAKLQRLIVDLIGKDNWTDLDADVKGDAYEGLLQKNAEDTKGGAGQYFTPRPLIKAIVDVIRPTPNTVICDPAVGTGGFLLAVHDYILKNYRLDSEQKEHLETEALRGFELVDSVARLCLMNMALHGIGGGTTVPIERRDSLEKKPGEFYEMVLTNPPFGKKSSVTIMNGAGKKSKESLIVYRDDFWTSTSNKQLNFLQHVYTILKINGRAAVVVPDNVLFESGAAQRVRENLLRTCDVHTLLRLPTGVFYAQGVKANVVFFDKRLDDGIPKTEKLWIYDFRTNQNFTLKTRPLKRANLDDFVECYNPENRFDRKATWSEENRQGRWREFSYDALLQRYKLNLDISWVEDENFKDDLDEPDVIAGRILENLQKALEKFDLIHRDMKSS